MSAKSLTSFEISLKSQIEEYKQLIDTITLKNVDQHEIGNGLKALAQIFYNWIYALFKLYRKNPLQKWTRNQGTHIKKSVANGFF